MIQNNDPTKDPLFPEQSEQGGTDLPLTDDSVEPQNIEGEAPLSSGGDESAQIIALEAELASTNDKMMRALADAENTRRRAQKDREDAGKYAVSSFARDLLDFADNFSRALAAFPADIKEIDPRLENVVDGVAAMERTLLQVFEKHGIEKIEPLDERFDPNRHEVMFEAAMPGKEPGTIIQVIEPGYMLGARLLRPARVGIAKDDGTVPLSTAPGSQIDEQA